MRTLILLGFVLGLPLSACSRGAAPPPPSSSEAAAAAAPALPAGMARVTDHSEVCMVNDMYMGRPQIPVQVEGRTYFGCCPDCKMKLENMPATRTATLGRSATATIPICRLRCRASAPDA